MLDKFISIVVIIILISSYCCIGLIENGAFDSRCKKDSIVKFPVIEKKIRGKIKYLRYLKLDISDLPDKMAKQLKSSVGIVLQKIAETALSDKQLTEEYISYTPYIETLYIDLKTGIARCNEDPQIRDEMYNRLSAKMYVVEDAVNLIYKAIKEKQREINAECLDLKNAKLSLTSDDFFTRLKNETILLRYEEKEDITELKEKYDENWKRSITKQD